MAFFVGGTLFLKRKQADGSITQYRCRLAEIREYELFIDYPIDEKTGKTAELEYQTAFEASYIVENHVFRFPVVFERRIPGHVPLLSLSYKGEKSIQRVQRRNFVRIETSQNVAVHSLNGKFSPLISLTSDISGGGTSVILTPSSEVEAEDAVELWFALVSAVSETRYLKVKGTVSRIFTDQSTGRQKASIRFECENEREQQPFIRFCFEKQLEERRKMLNFKFGLLGKHSK